MGAYDTAFQQVIPDDEKWLDCCEHEGAKELVVEACLLCIDLVSGIATGTSKVHLSETDRNSFLKRWAGVCYPGTTFKQAMEINVKTAFEINRLSRVVGEDDRLTTASLSFLDAAQKQYDKLTAGGVPDGLRPWHRLLEESDHEAG